MTSEPNDHGEPTTSRPSRRMRLAWQGACAAGLIAALSVVAREADGTRPMTVAAPASAMLPAFTPSAAASAQSAVAVSRAAPLHTLGGPGPFALVRVDPARLDPPSGLREDTMSQGSFADQDIPFLRLAVAEAAAVAAPGLFVTLVRRAADGQGLFLARTGERGRIDTRVGPVETLDATLQAIRDGGGSRVCTGFTTRPPAAVRVDGWLCAPLGQAPEPRAIACALDRLVRNGQASTARGEPARNTAVRDTACRPAPGPVDETGSIRLAREPARQKPARQERRRHGPHPRRRTQAGAVGAN